MTTLSADDLGGRAMVQDHPVPNTLDVPHREEGCRRSLSSELEAFLFDRFTTRLEDRYTGRRV
jgi:hypothetical protein